MCSLLSAQYDTWLGDRRSLHEDNRLLTLGNGTKKWKTWTLKGFGWDEKVHMQIRTLAEKLWRHTSGVSQSSPPYQIRDKQKGPFFTSCFVTDILLQQILRWVGSTPSLGSSGSSVRHLCSSTERQPGWLRQKHNRPPPGCWDVSSICCFGPEIHKPQCSSCEIHEVWMIFQILVKLKRSKTTEMLLDIYII